MSYKPKVYDDAILIKGDRQWNKNAFIGECIYWSLVVGISFFLPGDAPIWWLLFGIIFWLLTLGPRFGEHFGLTYARPEWRTTNIYGLKTEYANNKHYNEAIDECIAEKVRLKENFNAQPWQEMFYDMNRQIEEQRRLEKEKALQIDRRDFAHEMRTAYKLENGEQVE